VNALKSRRSAAVALLAAAVAAGFGTRAPSRPDLAETAPAPASRFAVDGALATDRASHLVWQRCSVGQRWTEGGCIGVVRQMSWQDAMSQGKQGWRLPTKDELLTLVSASKDIAIDERVFPDMEFNKLWYWTSTRSESSTWYVAFGGGSAHLGVPGDRNSVRLVKGG
jgi:Protein of unknown function (DUF1566)